MDMKKRAKDAIQKIEDCIANDKCELVDCAYYGTLSSLHSLFEYFNAMEEVIHCRDCKYYVKEKDVDVFKCVLWSMNMYGDFFCASGERRGIEGDE